MRMENSRSSCKITNQRIVIKNIDLAKISFIVKSKFEKQQKSILGYVWFIRPHYFLIYLFVFSVVVQIQVPKYTFGRDIVPSFRLHYRRHKMSQQPQWGI